MRFIEVTSRNKRKEMMSYDELNGWLRKKARHTVIACYYRDRTSRSMPFDMRPKVSMRYEFIDGMNAVPARRDGMELDKVVL